MSKKDEQVQYQNETSTEKSSTKKSKKSLIIGTIFLVALPIAAGVGVGFLINDLFIGKTADYSNIDATELKDDSQTVMQKYEECKNSTQDYQTSLKPYEMITVAYNLFAEEEHSKQVTIGSAVASIVHQTIRCFTIRDGNEYLEESISLSKFAAVAARMNEKESGNIDLYEGQTKTNTTATWPDTHYEYTNDEYAGLFGRTPKIPLIYIVSKKTVISSKTIVTKTDTGYTVDLTLDPLKSVVNYVKQMKSISKLADYPAFSGVRTIFTLDNNLMIKHLKVSEQYYAKTSQGVGSNIDATLNIFYECGDNYKLPTLTEDFYYGEYENA